MLDALRGRRPAMARCDLFQGEPARVRVERPRKGTIVENQAVVQGSVAYFGPCSVPSDKDKTLSMRIEASRYPNYAGQEQKRAMSVAGDEMSLTDPVAAVGGTNCLVWKRAKQRAPGRASGRCGTRGAVVERPQAVP